MAGPPFGPVLTRVSLPVHAIAGAPGRRPSRSRSSAARVPAGTAANASPRGPIPVARTRTEPPRARAGRPELPAQLGVELDERQVDEERMRHHGHGPLASRDRRETCTSSPGGRPGLVPPPVPDPLVVVLVHQALGQARGVSWQGFRNSPPVAQPQVEARPHGPGVRGEDEHGEAAAAQLGVQPLVVSADSASASFTLAQQLGVGTRRGQVGIQVRPSRSRKRPGRGRRDRALGRIPEALDGARADRPARDGRRARGSTGGIRASARRRGPPSPPCQRILSISASASAALAKRDAIRNG